VISSNNCPSALPVNRSCVPAELSALPHWVTWRYEWRQDHWTKPPSQANRHHADVTDPTTWTTFDTVWQRYTQDGADGIGFVVTADLGLVGVDLDHCRDPDTGIIAEWAQAIVDRLDSYTEVSPSGTGLRIWAYGTLPPKGRKHGNIELYSGVRYLTVTGVHVTGTPVWIHPRQEALTALHAEVFPPPAPHDPGVVTSSPPLDDDAVLQLVQTAANAEKFTRLRDGDTTDYPSHSEADLALVCLLAFYTRDPTQLDRLFLASKLPREKWDRADYRQRTIAAALEFVTDHHIPRPAPMAEDRDTRVEPLTLEAPMDLTPEPVPETDDLTPWVKPTIQLTTAMTAIVDAVQDAIGTLPDGPHLYQRARQLCLIARGPTPPKWLRRAPDTPVIVPADPAYVRELATQAATWHKFDGRKKTWVPTLPPPWVIETLLGRPSWTFPPLEGLISTPTVRPDGSLLDTPGYDHPSGLYLDLNGVRYPPLPARPTLDDARTAIGRLHEVWRDFPFVAPHHFSASLAALLSLVARHAIPGNVPASAVRSTIRGSGKGLLIDTIALIATGRHAPRWAQTTDEDEERKRLLTVALAGDAVIHIDNVTHPFGSAPLDLALTAPTFSDRVLGQQVSREAPIQVVFFASGNNMVFQGDMARRVVPIDLDPKMERPEERHDFAHSPLLPWVLQERPVLVMAALTILRAYFIAGSPRQGLVPFGSFEEWSSLIRHALVWAGEADPCAGRQNLEAESDPDYECLHNLLAAWKAHYGNDLKTVKSIKDDLDTHGHREDGRWTVGPAWRDLHSALAALDRHGEINVRAIGYALRRWKGRMIDQICLVDVGTDRSGAKQWRLTHP
jgi:hypothetical protein